MKTTCILAAGSLTSHGYGRMTRGGKALSLHRLAWEAVNGPIPDGMQIDHLCRNRACINPDHMEVVTQRENVLRGEGLAAVNAKKTHCPRNHPLSGANVAIRKGSRFCKTCMAMHQRAYYKRVIKSKGKS